MTINETALSNIIHLLRNSELVGELSSLTSQLEILKHTDKHNRISIEKEIPENLKEHFDNNALCSFTTEQSICIYPVINNSIHIALAYHRAKTALRCKIEPHEKILDQSIVQEKHPDNPNLIRVIASIRYTTKFD
jgi:hypothetical protein